MSQIKGYGNSGVVKIGQFKIQRLRDTGEIQIEVFSTREGQRAPIQLKGPSSEILTVAMLLERGVRECIDRKADIYRIYTTDKIETIKEMEKYENPD